jgi:flagellar hook protein FlgE
MTSIPRIALTGLNASLAQLGSAAHNIANANTQGFHRQEVELAAGPQAKNAFMANLAVFRTADDMAGTLLSIHS